MSSTTPRRPVLTIATVLAWADAHHRRTGRWPNSHSGKVLDAPEETWRRINWALSGGYRRLPGGSSLAQILRKHRNVPIPCAPDWPRLSIPQILRWADHYYQKKGRWPTRTGCGTTLDPPYENWLTIDSALATGRRGLPGRNSLARLLSENRGVYNVAYMPRLTIKQILAWADAHHRRTGQWPKAQPKAVPVQDDPRENWSAINACLHVGLRGLPGGDTLAEVLYRYRGIENNYTRPRLTIPQILRLARAHWQRTGKWPQAPDGPVRGAPGDTWMIIHQALTSGCRGLPGGTTLAKLLKARYGVPIAGAPPHLRKRQMLAWADAHHERTGMWPRIKSGPIPESATDTWFRVDVALRMGMRGLLGGSTLHRFLVEHGRGNVPSHARNAPRGGHVHWLRSTPITEDQVFGWAKVHQRDTGHWPTVSCGTISDAGGVTWKSVDLALRKGTRGLPGGSSVARLLARRGAPPTRRRRLRTAIGRFARVPRPCRP